MADIVWQTGCSQFIGGEKITPQQWQTRLEISRRNGMHTWLSTLLRIRQQKISGNDEEGGKGEICDNAKYCEIKGNISQAVKLHGTVDYPLYYVTLILFGYLWG